MDERYSISRGATEFAPGAGDSARRKRHAYVAGAREALSSAEPLVLQRAIQAALEIGVDERAARFIAGHASAEILILAQS